MKYAYPTSFMRGGITESERHILQKYGCDKATFTHRQSMPAVPEGDPVTIVRNGIHQVSHFTADSRHVTVWTHLWTRLPTEPLTPVYL